MPGLVYIITVLHTVLHTSVTYSENFIEISAHWKIAGVAF